MRVLAIDPGGTTGWAGWGCSHSHPGQTSFGQIPGGLLAVQQLVDELPHLTDLVIERYTISARTVKFSRQTDALEITGLLRYLATKNRVNVHFQQPSEAMRLFTDERLKAGGWWARGEEHARDALRHLGFFLVKNKIIKIRDFDGGAYGPR